MSSPANRILEDPDLKNSLNAFFSNTSPFLHVIYLTIIALLGVMAAGMALIHIPVYVQSKGIIRPSAEVSHIISPVPGIIRKINVIENQYVTKGYPILLLQTEKEIYQKNLWLKELQSIRTWITDLKELSLKTINPLKIKSQKYIIDLQLFERRLNSIDLRLLAAQTDLKKIKTLFDEKFVSEKEFEESTLKCKSILAEKDQLTSEKSKQWQLDLDEFTSRENGLVKQINEISYLIDNSTVYAPLNGIIQGIRNKYPGEYCSVGSGLCNLIPDTSLVAELFVQPKDIGFISTGQMVRLLIDSYDYKYWGALNSRCNSISEDVELIENQALFRVICELPSEPFLEYRKKKVRPGKGMTLSAQFLITEKNGWQLLKDEAYNLISKNQEDQKK